MQVAEVVVIEVVVIEVVVETVEVVAKAMAPTTAAKVAVARAEALAMKARQGGMEAASEVVERLEAKLGATRAVVLKGCQEEMLAVEDDREAKTVEGARGGRRSSRCDQSHTCRPKSHAPCTR